MWIHAPYKWGFIRRKPHMSSFCKRHDIIGRHDLRINHDHVIRVEKLKHDSFAKSCNHIMYDNFYIINKY